MIFCKSGVVSIQGPDYEIATDLTAIIIGCRKTFERNLGEQAANDLIAKIGRQALNVPEGLSVVSIDLGEIIGGEE